jgi:hypothetical protein
VSGVILFALCAWPFAATRAGEVPADKKQAEIEALVAQLRSDDDEARDKATAAIAGRALEDWERLKPFAESTEPEVRARVRRAMAGAAQSLLPKWIEQTEKEIAAHDAYKREFEQAIKGLEKNEETLEWERQLAELELADKRLTDQIRARVQAAKDLAEKEEDLKADQANIEAKFKLERDALAEKILKAKEALKTAKEKAGEGSSERYRKIREEFVARDRSERPESLRLRTRLLQLCDLRGDRALNLAYRPDMNRAFDPRLLPFEKRLGLKIAYEDMDLTFSQVMARMGEWAGVEMVVSPKVPAEIADGAKADKRSTEQDLKSLIIGLAAMLNLECQIDADAQRIVIAPKRK